MNPQAHLIGQDYSVYYHIIVVIAVLCFGMALCSVRLFRRNRSYRFIGLVWAGFVVLVLLGSIGLSFSIHSERLLWRASCVRLAASYANIISKFNHEKILSGSPEVFSDWSPPLFSQDNPPPSPILPDEIGTSSAASSPPEAVTEKLSIPSDFICRSEPLIHTDHSEKPLQVLRRNQWAVAKLTNDNQAFYNCQRQLCVQWRTVPNATTYRLQWGEYRGDETQWFTVYTGAKTSCTLTVPATTQLVLRVRAENGTPEDDPDYNQIIDILDFPVKVNELVGYTYTLRFVDDQSLQFIASPISDANHNGFIDPQEVPNDIGELLTAGPLFQFVREHHVRAMKIEEIIDQWGKWFSIAEPLYTPDGRVNGIFAMDFDVNYIHRQILLGQIYPLFLFVAISLFYLGTVLVINYLQIKNEKIKHLLKELQIVVLELTESKHMTEKALQVKTLFLNNMSHEFRTPLNAILGFAEILHYRTKRCVEDERALCSEAIKQIKDNGTCLIELIDNVLDIAAAEGSRTSVLTFTQIDLRTLITEIVESMQHRAKAKAITLSLKECGPIPERIESNSSRIRQILVHLIGNAIKFTEQGSVLVSFGVEPSTCSQDVPMLYVSVSDTGIGIDSRYLSAVFKPFLQVDSSLTRSYSGTGIGLSVARQAAEMLNGGISVESQLDKGSTFTFTFPGHITECVKNERDPVEKSS